MRWKKSHKATNENEECVDQLEVDKEFDSDIEYNPADTQSKCICQNRYSK